MPYDPIIERRWPEILPTLDALGLEARHSVPESGGDRITIHRGGEDGEPLGTVTFVAGGWYRSQAADDDGNVHRGPPHRLILDAFEDVIDDIRRTRAVGPSDDAGRGG